MQGWHLRRMYDWDGVEKKLGQLYKTDPAKAAKIEEEYLKLKGKVDTLHNTGMDIGGIETSIAKRRKPASPELRELLEQFDNLSDTVLISGRKAATSISTANFYSALKHSGLASESFIPGYVKLPGKIGKVVGTLKLAKKVAGKKKQPIIHSWGEMSGMYVPAPMYADLVRHATELHHKPSELMSMWVKYLIRPFKLGNVVYHYLARGHNSVSNIIAMQLATGAILPHIFLEGKNALFDLLSRGTDFQIYSRFFPSLRESSLMLHEQFSNLIANESKNLFSKTFIGSISKGIQKSMAWEEGVGKLTIFKIAKKPIERGGLGLSDQEAVLLAEKFMIDYGNVPPIVDVLRRRWGIFPFMTYSYKMAGNLIRAPFRQPEVIARQFRTLDAIHSLVDPKVYEGEEGGIPEWMRDKMLILFRLPGKEARYLNPWPYLPCNIFTTEGQASLDPITKTILGNLGQPFKGFFELATNRNTFTGQDIVPKGADPITTMTLRGEYLFKQLAPLRTVQKLLAAMSQTPLTAKAKPRKAWEVLLDINNFDIDKNVELAYKTKMNQYAETVKLAGKVLKMPNLSESEKQTRFENMMRYADELRTEAVKAGENITKVRGLEEYLLTSGARPEDLPLLVKQFGMTPDSEIQAAAIQHGIEGRTTVQQINDQFEQAIQSLGLGEGTAPILPSPPNTTDYRKMQPQTELMMSADEIMRGTAEPFNFEKKREILPSLPK